MTATAPTATALVARQGDFVLSGPVGSFDAYMDKVSRIPVLSREDEAELAHRFRDDGDLDAARRLVMSHLRFVVHIARGYSGYGLPLGDVVQEGNVGLMKAVKRFDPTSACGLVSFAGPLDSRRIHEYVLRNWRLVKVATTKAQRKLFFNLRKMKKNLAWLSAEETQNVARDLKVTPEEVTGDGKRLSARDLSFDPVPDTGVRTATRPTPPLRIFQHRMQIRRCKSKTPSGRTPRAIACSRRCRLWMRGRATSW
jgi:RNA polymerase sigma-32 factor